MNPIYACSRGYSKTTSAEANTYPFIASAVIELLSSNWKLLPKQDIFLGVLCKHSRECFRMTTSAHWLHCRFYFSDLILCFHHRISDQKEPLVSLVIIFRWGTWGSLDPFWYQGLYNGRTQVVEEGYIDVQYECNILRYCINFKEELGVKLIYWLIDHNVSLFIIIYLPACRDLIFQRCGSFFCFNHFKY